jgi:hypothetical protein
MQTTWLAAVPEQGRSVPRAQGGPYRTLTLIERVLPYQFDARTTFVMEADGVHCTISLPTSEHKMIDHRSVP